MPVRPAVARSCASTAAAATASRCAARSSSEQLVGSIVYDDPRLTGYLVQLRADGTGAARAREGRRRHRRASDLAAAAARRFAAAGLVWDDIVVVSQLPVTSKSGGSQKNWKRTNVAVMS